MLPPQGSSQHPGLCLLVTVLAQPRENLRGQGQSLARFWGLQLANEKPCASRARAVPVLDPLHTMGHGNCPGLPVKRCPLEAEHLAAPQAIGESHRHGQRQPMSLGDCEQLSGLVDTKGPALPRAHLRWPGQRRHVAPDNAFTFSFTPGSFLGPSHKLVGCATGPVRLGDGLRREDPCPPRARSDSRQRRIAVIRGYMKLARTCPYAVRNVQRGSLIRIRSGHQRCRQPWRCQPHGEGQRQGAGPCRGSAARRPWHAKHPGRSPA